LERPHAHGDLRRKVIDANQTNVNKTTTAFYYEKVIYKYSRHLVIAKGRRRLC
jgi:hypothetical protein